MMATDSKTGRTETQSTPSRRANRQGHAEQPVAIVTRAAGSIGSAIVLRLAHLGMHVVACDGPDRARLPGVEGAGGSAETSIVAMPADMTSDADIERVVERTLSAFGRIDVLVNGQAGVETGSQPKDTFADLAEDIANSMRSPLLFIRAVVPHMVAGGGGRIVNIASCAGRYRSAYFHQAGENVSRLRESGSDGALLALTRELAFELAPHRIRVNAATIGWIRTAAAEPAWQALSERERSFLLEEISLRRLGEPDEVAAVVEFLATDVSSYVTGTAIDVNGGWWMS